MIRAMGLGTGKMEFGDMTWDDIVKAIKWQRKMIDHVDTFASDWCRS